MTDDNNSALPTARATATLVTTLRSLAKSLEKESKKSAATATAKGGVSGMLDAAEAGALFKVAQHIWDAAQALDATGSAGQTDCAQGGQP